MQASVVIVLGLLSQIPSDRGLGFEASPQGCQCVAGQGLGYGVGDDCRLSEEKGRGSRGSSLLGKQHALGIPSDNDIRCAAPLAVNEFCYRTVSAVLNRYDWQPPAWLDMDVSATA